MRTPRRILLSLFGLTNRWYLPQQRISPCRCICVRKCMTFIQDDWLHFLFLLYFAFFFKTKSTENHLLHTSVNSEKKKPEWKWFWMWSVRGQCFPFHQVRCMYMSVSIKQNWVVLVWAFCVFYLLEIFLLLPFIDAVYTVYPYQIFNDVYWFIHLIKILLNTLAIHEV